jgi:glycosyltransferase involved in cell wall biosynthesis
MRIILLGNYPPDGQESMERFAQMLNTGFNNAGVASEIWRPISVLAMGGGPMNQGFRKWLGYIDKWVIFPLVLRWRLRRKVLAEPDVRFHICDHSNSPYLFHLDPQRSSITCHDVLAIRGGLGHADAHVAASRFGRVLQRWIYYHLSRAQRLAAVSQFTLRQLLDLAAQNSEKFPANWQVIHNAFNDKFWPMAAPECATLLHQAGLGTSPHFILHVGSGQPRKNRPLLLELVHTLGSRWTGSICFAGEAPNEELLARVEQLGLQERVKFIVKPDHSTLVALYSSCEAFIFPSYSEGFGWPVIEAQACGAPVIASTIEPMPEVSGGTALHADPFDPKAFGEALLTLQNPSIRAALVQRGFANSYRFEPTHMIQAYLRICQLAPA